MQSNLFTFEKELKELSSLEESLSWNEERDKIDVVLLSVCSLLKCHNKFVNHDYPCLIFGWRQREWIQSLIGWTLSLLVLLFGVLTLWLWYFICAIDLTGITTFLSSLEWLWCPNGSWSDKANDIIVLWSQRTRGLQREVEKNK